MRKYPSSTTAVRSSIGSGGSVKSADALRQAFRSILLGDLGGETFPDFWCFPSALHWQTMIFRFASASYWQSQIHLVRFPVHPTGKPLWGGGLACFPSGSHWEMTTRGSNGNWFPSASHWEMTTTRSTGNWFPSGSHWEMTTTGSTGNWFPNGSHWESHWELVSQWLPLGNPLEPGFPVAPTLVRF